MLRAPSVHVVTQRLKADSSRVVQCTVSAALAVARLSPSRAIKNIRIISPSPGVTRRHGTARVPSGITPVLERSAGDTLDAYPVSRMGNKLSLNREFLIESVG
jgi:hypothetical protein